MSFLKPGTYQKIGLIERVVPYATESVSLLQWLWCIEKWATYVQVNTLELEQLHKQYKPLNSTYPTCELEWMLISIGLEISCQESKYWKSILLLTD